MWYGFPPKRPSRPLWRAAKVPPWPFFNFFTNGPKMTNSGPFWTPPSLVGERGVESRPTPMEDLSIPFQNHTPPKGITPRIFPVEFHQDFLRHDFLGVHWAMYRATYGKKRRTVLLEVKMATSRGTKHSTWVQMWWQQET